MLFGMQPTQAELRPILAARDRLPIQSGQALPVPSMQPGDLATIDEPGTAGTVGDAQTQPAEAFQWGEGGERLTPDQIAEQHRTASEQMAAGMDYSPVGHWTQGLARVAQALAGSMQERDVVKAERANAAEGQTIAQLIANPPANGAGTAGYDANLLSASANPYVSSIVRNLAATERERRIKAAAPEYFMSGGDRVRFDPTSGESKVVYDAPEDFQTYANTMGYQPGTPEYNTAAKDFVLRGNGPTAYGYDVDLENTRQTNRLGLEDTRHSNRAALRSTPTYSDLHPRPHATGGGGGGSSRAPTMAGTMAPVLAKVARGEVLTPAEQKAWNMYRPPNRGGKPGSAAAALVAGGVPAAGAKPTGPPVGTVRGGFKFKGGDATNRANWIKM